MLQKTSFLSASEGVVGGGGLFLFESRLETHLASQLQAINNVTLHRGADATVDPSFPGAVHLWQVPNETWHGETRTRSHGL